MLQNGRLSTLDTLSAALAVLGVVFGGAGSVFGAPAIQLAGPVFWLTTAVTLVFEHWAWRWRVLYPLVVPRPDFRGTWRGEVISTWIDPKTSCRIEPIEVYLVIRQTFAMVHVRMVTAESSSDTTSAAVSRESSGIYVLTATYRNEPEARVRDRSEIHYGSLRLTTAERRPASLTGDYWTDRQTTGDIRLSQRKGALSHTFEAAREAFR